MNTVPFQPRLFDMRSAYESIEDLFWKLLAFESEDEREAFLTSRTNCSSADERELRVLLEQYKSSERVFGKLDHQPRTPILDVTVDSHAVARASQKSQLAMGSTIGPYKLLEPIGEGGMGLVYLAQQSHPVRRKVALKVIKPGMDSHQVIARFEAERQALAMMDHPHIAKVLDAGETESGLPYFVMELVRGIPMTEYCDRARMRTRERIDLFCDACRAIQHAHNKGIIHRDIKPSNVLVTEEEGKPIVKVIDFGVAKALSSQLTDKTLFTGMFQMLGTPLYMSPEQASLSNLDVDTRSDVYSLGVMLYELVSGTLPIDRDSAKELSFEQLRKQICEDEPPPPSKRLSTLRDERETIAERRGIDPRNLHRLASNEIDWIVMKAIDKERSRRYQSARELGDDLQRLLNGDAVLACPPSLVYRARKSIRKHPTIFASTVVTLVAAVVITTLSILQARTSDRLSLEAQASAREAEIKAAESNAVLSFMLYDLLGSADPNEAKGRSLRVDEIIDKGVRAVDKAFTDQPLVKATVHSMLARLLRANGDAVRAHEQSQQCYRIRQRVLGDHDPATLHAAYDLAIGLRDLDRFDEARTLQERVRSDREKQLGAQNIDTLFSALELANLDWIAGNYGDAVDACHVVLAIAPNENAFDHRLRLDAKRLLATAYTDQDRFDDAAGMIREFIDEMETHFPGRLTSILIAKRDLAEIYDRQLKHRECEQLLNEVLAEQIQLLGEMHPSTIETLSRLGSLQRVTNRPHESIRTLERAWKRLQEAKDADERSIATVANNLAITHQMLNQYPQSKRFLESSLQVHERLFGPEHPNTLSVWHNLAETHRGLEQFQEALQIDQRVLATRIRVLGAMHTDTVRSMSNIGRNHLATENDAEAERMFRRVYDARVNIYGRRSPATLETQENLLVALMNQWKLAESKVLYRSMFAIIGSEDFATEDPVTWREVVSTLIGYAQAMSDAGEQIESATAMMQLVSLRRSVLGTDHPATINAEKDLMIILSRLAAEGLDGIEDWIELVEERGAWLTRLFPAIIPFGL